MKTTFQNIVKGGMLCTALAATVAACTDDHFDIRVSDASGANTIWQNIEATSELDSVAMILRRAKVMNSEIDKGEKQTFASLLNGDQEMTVWLPKNGTFNAKQYLDILDRADSLFADTCQATATASVNEAMRLNYQVASQFVRNHMARFNQGSAADKDARMMNGKVCAFSQSNHTFNGAPVIGSAIVSSNGQLYLLNGESTYEHNIYDLLSVRSEFSDIFAMIDAYSKYTFNESASTPGAMNEFGKIEYVDSVYSSDNEMINNASLKVLSNEDSLSISFFPSNEALATAKDKIASLYNFKKSYNYEYSSTSHDFSYKGANALRLDQNAIDSLQQREMLNDLLATTTVSVSRVVTADKRRDSVAVFNEFLTRDSVFTTKNICLYNATPGEANPMFAGLSPIKASNGYIYALPEYTIDPAYGLVKRSEIKASRGGLCDVQGSTQDWGQRIDLTSANTLQTEPDEDGNTRDSIDLCGLIPDNTYFYFPVSGNSTMMIDFQLNNIYSTNYNISIIMLPNKTCTSNIRLDDKGQPIIEKPKFDAALYDDDGKVLSQVKGVEVNQEKAERITLWENYKFPYTYKGLPSDKNSFPRLRISLPYSYHRTGKVKALSILSVIVEPVRE